MTHRSTWKRVEREVAKYFQEIDPEAKRTPLSGATEVPTLADVITKLPFFIDTKMRASFTHHSLFKETEKRARREEKVPILLTKEKEDESFLVIMRLSDFIEVVKDGIRV
ncbi:MAG: hypothetical protein ACXQTS_04430 [Candidatus Methanospirareceae archaeon]